MGIQVLKPGLLTTVQDQGRFGHQRIGMSPAGAMDLHAMRLANLLVDNDRDEAVLEMTMLGPKLQFTRGCVFAVTGADMGARLDGEMVPWGCAVTAPAGSVLQFGAARSGCRAYLAAVLRGLEATPYISVLGHYDFCCKFSPYPDRSMSYAVAPALFDAIFRHLIQNGKGLEINTSPWRDGPSWGLDILSRYRALGGEFVTVGADAHKPGQVGRRIDEALDLARAAGIPYVATFQALQPTLHRL